MINKTPANQRYQFKPFFGSSHTWALKHLGSLAQESIVLDVGIGSGIMAQHLRSYGVHNVFGLESESEARQSCSSMYQQIFSTLEQVQSYQFDCILLLDVLEHMSDPFTFLANLHSKLKPNGQIFISVPNVAHWSLRLSLLFGFWNYTDRGLLDRTHLHFFTRKHFQELCHSCAELRLTELSGSISPAEFVLPKIIVETYFFKLFSQARQLAALAFPGLCAYQHLAILKKFT